MAKRRSRNSKGRKKTTKRSKSRSASKSPSDSEESLFDGIDPSLVGVPLRHAAQERYLNYSLSVITSRALPDVRDGLKPVQRRILFTMNQQGLTFDDQAPLSAPRSSVT